MELGAVVCLPRDPLCAACPIAEHCKAHRQGSQNEVPAKRAKPATVSLEHRLLVIRDRGRILLAPGSRVRGFWDLPEPFKGARLTRRVGEFRHSILNRRYLFVVWEARTSVTPPGFTWFREKSLHEIPLCTAAKKGLSCFKK
jgi:adenine-specific DNA glycosylase